MLNKNLSNREKSFKYNCNKITIRRFINKEKQKLQTKKEVDKKRRKLLSTTVLKQRNYNTTQGTITCKEKFSKTVGNTLVRNRLKENGFKGYKNQILQNKKNFRPR